MFNRRNVGISLVGVLALGMVARADDTTENAIDIKPKNSVVDVLCGIFSRSETICLARNVSTADSFLKVKYFQNDALFGAATTVSLISDLDSKIHTAIYKAIIVQRDANSGQFIARSYQLDVTEDDVAKKVEAKLSIDNGAPKLIQLKPAPATR